MNIKITKSTYKTKENKRAIIYDCSAKNYRKKINTGIFIEDGYLDNPEITLSIALNITLEKLKDKKDEVVGMISVNDMDANILVVSENGYGKRSSLEDYRLTNRGGKGVKTISITEKTGKLVTLKSVSDSDDLMIINKSGIAIRMQVEDLRVMGRATQGVKVISLKDGDSIAAVAKVMKDDDDIEDINDIEFTGDAV